MAKARRAYTHEDGPPPYAADLVRSAILRKMRRVQKKDPDALKTATDEWQRMMMKSRDRWYVVLWTIH